MTLLELLIVLLIIGLVMAVAYPLYTGYLESARRTDAKSALVDIAGRLERCYTLNQTYQGCVDDLDRGMESAKGFYEIQASLEASTYTLIASPQGAQENDSCGELTLTQSGNEAPKACW
ncbi:type IV pilin [Aidingimonas halophila]|nr:type IV pilin protein [Aidingimonas halophila]GHC37022.1 type IV pilin [Aidingimonas halophila]